MAYSDIWTNANDADFQGRCWAALWDVANKVQAGDTGFPASGQDGTGDDTFAINVLRDNTRITSKQLAQQVLRNATIASNPATSTDNDIQYQINNSWAALREIG
jgi:hypothetical protein